MKKRWLPFLVFSLLLAACGGKQPTPGEPLPAPPPGGGPASSMQPPANPPAAGGPPPADPGGQPPAGSAPPPAATASDPGAAMYVQGQSSEVLPQETYLAQVSAASGATWTYRTTLIGTLPYPQQFDLGAFCRLFPRADGAGYEVIFGGAFDNRAVDEARAYQGDVRRTLSADLTTWGEPMLFSTRGGDYAIDSDGQFYYLLNAHPEGWLLSKYDEDFNLVKSVIVPLPAGHAANDQMLRVWDGRVYLSGLYNPNYASMQEGQRAGPDDVLNTHVWVYDRDLNPLEDHILSDESNINGGTLIPYGEGFAYVASDNFVRNNLKAYIYDADWNFIRSLLLEENAQWSMGGVVDGETIYVAYHRGEHSRGDVWLSIYDMNWNRLEQMRITQVQEGFNAQRPWVLLDGDRLFVAYDLARDSQGILDFQCVINVYER